MSHFLKNWKLVETADSGIEKEWYDVASQWYPANHPQDYHSAGIPVKPSPIGLVLSGGGAKGAYQAGVWKAMCEYGLADDIRAISGTSIGAVNAAAFATIHDPERIRLFWHDTVGTVVTPNFKALNSQGLFALARSFATNIFPLGGVLDRGALEMALMPLFPSIWPHEAPDVYATALEYGGFDLRHPLRASFRLVRFWLNAENDATLRLHKILASCAIPWCFDAVEIGGKSHVDGGWDSKGGDNLPIRPIVHRHPEIKTIIVVRCNSADIEPGYVKVPDKVDIIEIRPDKPLRGLFADEIDAVEADQIRGGAAKWSGTLAFNSDLTDKMFEQGYQDGMATFKSFCRVSDS